MVAVRPVEHPIGGREQLRFRDRAVAVGVDLAACWLTKPAIARRMPGHRRTPPRPIAVRVAVKAREGRLHFVDEFLMRDDAVVVRVEFGRVHEDHGRRGPPRSSLGAGGGPSFGGRRGGSATAVALARVLLGRAVAVAVREGELGLSILAQAVGDLAGFALPLVGQPPLPRPVA